MEQDAPASTPKLSTNVTSQLTTCEPWGLVATSGRPPYTIFLTSYGPDTMTVATLDASDNTLIYTDSTTNDTEIIGALIAAGISWYLRLTSVRMAASVQDS